MTNTRAEILQDLKTLRQVTDHYGGSCACVGCTQSKIEFLTLARHGCITRYYGWQRRTAEQVMADDFPANIKVLCHNCFFARRNEGYCPHER